MGFPIAYGAKTVSSRPIALYPEPVEDYADDGVVLRPALNSSSRQPLIAMATNSNQELSALVTITYYDMIREDETQISVANTTAEVRVQISSLALPFSSSTRETVHRIILPESSRQQDDVQQEASTPAGASGVVIKQPSVVFSSDGRHLACVVPYPPQQEQHRASVVVIFQLRKPRSRSITTPPPPRPSYITTQHESPAVLTSVATNPRIVHGHQLPDLPVQNGERVNHDDSKKHHHLLDVDQPLLIATSICDVSMSQDRTVRAGSVLLAGCSDGSIFVVGYRTGRVAGRLIASTDDDSGEESCSIDYMTHITTSSHSTNRQTPHDGVSKGRLVAIRSDGRAIIYESQIDTATNGHTATESQTEMHHASPEQGGSREKEPLLNGHGNASKYMLMDETSSDGVSHFTPLPSSKSISRRDVSETAATSTVSQIYQPHQPQRQLLMHLDLLTDLEGPFISATWINGCLLATLLDPFYFLDINDRDDRFKAHVWAIPNVGNHQGAETIPRHPLSCLDMTENRLKETAHVMFHFDIQEGEIQELNSIETTWKKSLNIHYDIASGCLAISSVVLDCVDSTPDRLLIRPFSCVWHWRTNVVGFTTTTNMAYGETDCARVTFMAQLYFAFDPRQGCCLVHISSACALSEHFDCRVSKTSYCTALLSPASCLFHNGWCVTEPCPLLLSASTVSFPFTSNPMSDDAVEIEWKESSIPTTYVSAYGQPQVASISKGSGRYVAVAASRGMCILECPKTDVNKACRHESRSTHTVNQRVHRQSSFTRLPHLGKTWRGLGSKWRFFGSEAEERAFRVLAMTWWEGIDSSESAVDDILSESLIVAVVQLESGQSDEVDRKRRRYLACWSPRRLGVGHQLIQQVGRSRHSSSSQWGVPLPDDLVPSSLTLLSEPVNERSVSKLSTRKAVVLLSAATDGSDRETGVRYATFQLQVKPIESVDTEATSGQLPYTTLCRCVSHGEVRLRDRSAVSALVSGIFLAGASFSFDLRQSEEGQDLGFDEYICTLGIIRSPGGGLHGVTVTTAGATVAAPVLIQGSKICDVPVYFLSDVVLGAKHDEGSGNHASTSNYHAWTIEQADGLMFCWFVPSTSGIRGQSAPLLYTLGTAKEFTASNNCLSTPALVFGSEVERDPHGYYLGAVCAIGDASTWMQESLSTNRSSFLLGPAPKSSFGCMMGVGQSSWRLHREIDGFDHAAFASNVLDIDCLAVGDLALYSPLFVTSLYAIFMEAARVYADFNPGIDGSPKGKARPNKLAVRSNPSSHARQKVVSTPNKDMVMMAMRLLVIRAVEFVATEVRKLEKTGQTGQQEMSHEFVLAMSFFAEVVDAVRACTTQLQFSSFFLEVGRQIEPSYSCHLFPLPMPFDAYGADINDYRRACNVDDLFGLSLKDGSLCVAASALPLFTTRRQSLKICVQLLHHCLLAFQENVVSMASTKFDVSGEERRYMNDILQFGLRLEDVDSHRVKNIIVDGQGTNGGLANSHNIQTTSSHKRDSEPSFLRFLPSWFYDSGSKREEKEIYEAASSFILLGFEESTYEYIEREREKDETGIADDEGTADHHEDTESVAGVVARALLAVAFASKGADARLKWKRTTGLARLLLGDYNLLAKDQSLSCSDVLEEIDLHEMDSLVSNGLKASETPAVSEDDRVAQFLVFRIMECTHECDRIEANMLLELVLLLLHRYDISEDVDAELPGLLLIGVIASHVADRPDAIIGQLSPSCPICKSYERVREELQRTI